MKIATRITFFILVKTNSFGKSLFSLFRKREIAIKGKVANRLFLPICVKFWIRSADRFLFYLQKTWEKK